jgi:hypothetical protein
MATELPKSPGSRSVTILKLTQADSPYSLTVEQCPCFITNEGATGALAVNLPTAAVGGEEVKALCLAAQDIKLTPGANNRIIGSDGTAFGDFANNKGVIGDAIGEKVTLICNGPDGSSNLEWVAEVQTNNNPGTVSNFNEEES